MPAICVLSRRCRIVLVFPYALPRVTVDEFFENYQRGKLSIWEIKNAKMLFFVQLIVCWLLDVLDVYTKKKKRKSSMD